MIVYKIKVRIKERFLFLINQATPPSPSQEEIGKALP